jgi:hypothetical protein
MFRPVQPHPATLEKMSIQRKTPECDQVMATAIYGTAVALSNLGKET